MPAALVQKFFVQKRRWLYLTHRWLGIVLCLFMALWFVSGVVMMYVGYPKLTPAERLARLPELSAETCCISLAAAVGALAPATQSSLKSITLTSVAGKPHYQFTTHDSKQISSVDAADGTLLTSVTRDAAIRSAQAFFPHTGVHYLDAVDEDSWTHSRGLDQHRPLHRVQIDDPDRSLLYISSMTGDVVRKATRNERIWNYAGAWLHWLYALRGGMFDGAWTNIVVYLSLAGVLLALAGSVVGLMRWRFRGRFRSGAKTPYRERYMRWHHLIGLAFAGITITWIFSGLMSMNPWRIFDAGQPALNRIAYSGGQLEADRFASDARQAITSLQGELRPREIAWHMLNGRPYLVATDGLGQTRILAAERKPLSDFPLPELVAAARKLFPENTATAELLQDYDSYYYARAAHTMAGHADKRLPVLRVKFDDPGRTWVHIDPYSGTLQSSLTSRQRTQRWLFALLHSWDLPVMLASRPLWDIALIFLSIGGFLLSATGIVIAIRRLR